MLDAKRKKQLISDETSKFLDSQFGGLDLSGSPDLQPHAEEEFATQDRHGFNRVDDSGLAGINQLKQMLADPPRDVVLEIAKETGNPGLLRELADERAAEIARNFCRRNPDYMRSDSNWRSMVETMAHNFLHDDSLDADEAQELLVEGGFWTLQNLTTAFKTLDRAGALEYPSNHARPLTEAQRVRIQQLAANGRVLDAVVLYVESRVGQDVGYEAAFALEDPEAFSCDPTFRAVLEEATVYCWECARTDYSPTESRQRYIHDYCAGRFVTLPLLDAAWESCRAAEKDAMRSALFEQVGENRTRNEIPSEQFDGLDDASIADLYHRTLRERAHSSRRPNGVLV